MMNNIEKERGKKEKRKEKIGNRIIKSDKINRQ